MVHLPVLRRLIFGLVMTGWFGSVSAQEPWPYKKASRALMNPRQARALSREKDAVLLRAGGSLSDADRRTIARYYVTHIFAGMTQPEALNSPSRFPDWRREIERDLEKLGNGSATRTYIRDDLVLKYLQPLVENNYHPACRYNAALMIGMLNEQEVNRASQIFFPVPLPAGRQFLGRILTDQNTPEAVRIAALIGLKRHAMYLTANGQSDSDMLRPLIEIAQAKQPRSGESADGFYWQKRLAIEALGKAGPSQASTILDPIVRDDTLPMSVRCAAAKALGELDYRGGSNGVDPASLVKGLGSVAVVACRNGIQRIRDYQAQNPDADEPVNAFRNPENAGPQVDPVVDQVRRRMQYELQCVKDGLTGVEKIANDKSTVTLLTNEIDSIERGLRDDALAATPKELIDRIGPPAVRLENAVKD